MTTRVERMSEGKTKCHLLFDIINTSTSPTSTAPSSSKPICSMSISFVQK